MKFTKHINMESLSDEMRSLQKYFGTYYTAKVLGDYRSYKLLRAEHSYKTIYNEMRDICEE